MSDAIQYFGHSILKRRADGVEVMSDNLGPGEELVDPNRKQTTKPADVPEEHHALTLGPDGVSAIAANTEIEERLGINEDGAGSDAILTESPDGVSASPVEALEAPAEEEAADEEEMTEQEKFEHDNTSDDELGLTDNSEEAAGDEQIDEGNEPSQVVVEQPAVMTDDNGPVEEAARPADTDTKQVWFDYASKNKGYTGEKDDITKADYIKQYG